MKNRVEILLDNDENVQRPLCQHGPGVLFRKVSVDDVSGPYADYYACSLHRDGKRCKFLVSRDVWARVENKEEINAKITAQVREIMHKGVNRKAEDSIKGFRDFCQTCGEFLTKENIVKHKKHKILKDLTVKQVEEIRGHPSKYLELRENNKSEAQYIFNDETLNFLELMVKDLGFTNILCIGTPTLHATLLKSERIRSLLLDIDERYAGLFPPEHFAKFNMFNGYFFESPENEEKLKRFLIKGEDDQIGIFLDPPFACRTELLAQCIYNLGQISRQVNKNVPDILTIFLILPYFMENYINQDLPQLEMLDYKVSYVNHSVFRNESDAGRFGSPVRIFTNALPSLIRLPKSEGYRECRKCRRWVSRENNHCPICRKCTSKNGGSYKHCNKCGICVKDFYKHCNSCDRCVQAFDHECGDYQRGASCWICRQRGHVEKNCSLSRKRGKRTSTRVCGICLKKNHSELICRQRKAILKEDCFLGKFSISTENQFS
ncbi:Zinc finger CCHC domain-containing protein 4 [Sergentomyia squamirostris]